MDTTEAAVAVLKEWWGSKYASDSPIPGIVESAARYLERLFDAAAQPAKPEPVRCGAVHPSGYRCTRVFGHDGMHRQEIGYPSPEQRVKEW